MRVLTLYLRSRAVPQVLAGVAVAAVGLSLLGTDIWLVAMAVAVGVSMASTGLGGQDVALDRTGAVPWPLWRAVHLVVTGAVMVAVFGWSGLEVTFRAAVGLTGLAAVGATFLGHQLAWLPPVVWLLVTITLPVTNDVVMWLVRPVGTTASTVTAVVIGLVGLVCYASRGPAVGGGL
jgi:hypothetical protein